MTVKLSRRQEEVMRCLLRGRSYKEIALELGTNVSTVRTHALALYRKFGVGDRSALFRAYSRSRTWAAAAVMHDHHRWVSVARWEELIVEMLDALEEA